MFDDLVGAFFSVGVDPFLVLFGGGIEGELGPVVDVQLGFGAGHAVGVEDFAERFAEVVFEIVVAFEPDAC